MTDNPNAFPFSAEYGHPAACGGMTLRDYFAAQAMAAIISKIPFMEYPEDWSPYTKTALGAYDYADAMLMARSLSRQNEEKDNGETAA